MTTTTAVQQGGDLAAGLVGTAKYYPTTEEAKDLIQWLFSTETQYDETLEAGRRRNEATKALLNWAKNPLDK